MSVRLPSKSLKTARESAFNRACSSTIVRTVEIRKGGTNGETTGNEIG
ncbi:hypothetical protein [Curvibacter phage PCA1]|nr:hypothetical protein [Curvibacter phage PCA1]